MASVVVLCPNNQRVTVKVEPNTIIYEVMREACLKQGYLPHNYSLLFQNRPVDLSADFRLSQLPPNCLLETCKCAVSTSEQRVVEIAVQASTRLTGRFPVDTSLADALAALQPSLLEPADQKTPVLAIMNREFVGLNSLTAVTFASLGYRGGKVLLRYLSKLVTTDKLAEIDARLAERAVHDEKLHELYERRRAQTEEREAQRQRRDEELEQMQRRSAAEQDRQVVAAAAGASVLSCLQPPSASDEANSSARPQNDDQPATARPSDSGRLERLRRLLNEVDDSLETGGEVPFDLSAIAAAVTANMPNPQFADFKFPSLPTPQPSEGGAKAAVAAVVASCERQPMLFRELADAPAAAEDGAPIDDEHFFDVTVADVRSMQKALSADAAWAESRALLPTALLERRTAERKAAAYRRCVMRVALPAGNERLVLQGCFLSAEPVSRLFDFISGELRLVSGSFSLALPPATRIQCSDNRSLLAADLAPSATLRLITTGDVQHQYERPVAAASEANDIAQQWLSANGAYEPFKPTVVESAETRANKRPPADYENEPRGSAQPPSQAPKWFKGHRK